MPNISAISDTVYFMDLDIRNILRVIVMHLDLIIAFLVKNELFVDINNLKEYIILGKLYTYVFMHLVGAHFC